MARDAARDAARGTARGSIGDMLQANAAVKLKELQAIDTWRQREFVEAGGWATMSLS